MQKQRKSREALKLRKRSETQLSNNLCFLEDTKTCCDHLSLSTFVTRNLKQLTMNSVISSVGKVRNSTLSYYCQLWEFLLFLGKGLIILLHGAPGVGKTTTAGKLSSMNRYNIMKGLYLTNCGEIEGMAETFRKPLFQITCGMFPLPIFHCI